MASAEGLTRRRGAAQAATDGEDSSSGRVASPAPKSTPSFNDRSPETSYSSGENGHKIAFDPRDISESEERSKQPKLTLMEEILLLGLKDKQVRLFFFWKRKSHFWRTGSLRHMYRATCLFGTTTYLTLFEVV
jgi:Golgi phosphoprotein 3